MSRRLTSTLLGSATAQRALPTTSSLAFARPASTTTTSTPPLSSATPSPSASTSAALPLTWPSYLALRRRRRLWSTLTSIPTTAAGLFVGGGYFAGLEADPTELIMGLEPLVIYGGATLGCMIFGYLIGPTLGSSLFSLTHPAYSRGSPSPLEIMDRELFEHIKRNRVDPRFQSVNNLPPDYYGEKITSLPTYRRWLRDQATYKRKAAHGVPGETAQE
ncbi:integral to membrane protein [Dioszegia hungarica]|uniref:Presequence translocated-associated motor subunit PAM17 n=1 Tax=Dioszegia hungarica TaxID=4972 RepID=A0AA38HD14_9TREE|nr:integral to membrane protein [Dioszegia hungarica]KAI9638852.1 integral to membrane protein [Dioszegia hungarica]